MTFQVYNRLGLAKQNSNSVFKHCVYKRQKIILLDDCNYEWNVFLPSSFLYIGKHIFRIVKEFDAILYKKRGVVRKNWIAQTSIPAM